MLIPYQVDVPMSRWPYMNFLLIGVVTLVSLAAFMGVDEMSTGQMVLDGWSSAGMFGHMLLHVDMVHLIGNMLFLWVFGNAVCAKITNTAYLPFFVALGLVAAATHNLFDGSPAIGASGAINGVVGMYLLLYPTNNISCLWLLGFHGSTFSISGMWLILLWLLFDIFGAALGGGGVAYWAHLGGFFVGAGVAALMLAAGWIKMTSTERSLFDVLAGRD